MQGKYLAGWVLLVSFFILSLRQIIKTIYNLSNPFGAGYNKNNSLPVVINVTNEETLRSSEDWRASPTLEGAGPTQF